MGLGLALAFYNLSSRNPNLDYMFLHTKPTKHNKMNFL